MEQGSGRRVSSSRGRRTAAMSVIVGLVVSVFALTGPAVGPAAAAAAALDENQVPEAAPARTSDELPTNRMIVRYADGRGPDTESLSDQAGGSVQPVRPLDDGSWVVELP